MARYRFLAATLLVLSAGVFFFAEQVITSDTWVWVEAAGGAAVLGYIALVYLQQRGALLTSFYQVFYWLGLLASALVISSGAYMIEIEKTGTANGTFWVALGFFVAGMEMTILGYRAGAKGVAGKAVRIPFFDRVAILVAIGGALGLSAYVLALHGGPILSGLNRVTFYIEITPKFLSYTPTIITQSFFFAAFYFLAKVRDRKSRILAGAIVIAYVFAGYFVLGQKFSLYINYANAWLFVLAALLPGFRIRRRDLVLATSLCLVVTAVVGWTYIDSGRGFGFILTRTALQSQLLWSVLGDSTSGAHWSCYFECAGFSSGREFISSEYLPLKRYLHYKEGGTTLSGFNPALPLMTLGFAATGVAYLALSFALGWLQRKAVNALRADNLIYGFVIFKAQLGLSLLVATASISAAPGVILMLCVMIAWRTVSVAMRRQRTLVTD